MRLKAWRVAIAAAVMAWAGGLYSQPARPPVRFINQGWTQIDRSLFYTTSQGSQLVPYSWYLALDQPGAGTARFNDNSLARYGYLENRDPTRNPDRLPLGFVRTAIRIGSASHVPPATRTRSIPAATPGAS